MRWLMGPLAALVLLSCASAEQPATEADAEAGPDAPLAISVEHVREACGSWQDYLDIHADTSNYFAENLGDTIERQDELKVEMTRAANRSGHAELAAAAAGVVRQDWDPEDRDRLIALCQEAGIPIRSSLPTAEEVAEMRERLELDDSQGSN